MKQQEFRKKLVLEMIHNTLENGTEEQRPERRRNTRQNMPRKIFTAPPQSDFEGGKWVKSTSKSTNSINVTLQDAQFLSKLFVTAQKIYYNATYVSLATLCTLHHVIAIQTEFSFPFSFFVSLNYYCKIKTACQNLFLLVQIKH